VQIPPFWHGLNEHMPDEDESTGELVLVDVSAADSVFDII
jgi:hypothetical protein